MWKELGKENHTAQSCNMYLGSARFCMYS